MTTLAVALLVISQDSTSPAAEQDGRVVGDTKVTYLFGSILPKEADWRPLTAEERRKIYWKNSWANPGIVFRAFAAGAADQYGNEPKEWGQGAGAYSKRVADRFATFAISDAVQAGLAAGMNYDVRYLRCKCKGFFRRWGHAAMQSFVTKNGDGQWRPNIPNMAGAIGSTAISVYGWYPDERRSFSAVGRASITQFVFPVFINSFVEFGPEFKRLFRR